MDEDGLSRIDGRGKSKCKNTLRLEIGVGRGGATSGEWEWPVRGVRGCVGVAPWCSSPVRLVLDREGLAQEEALVQFGGGDLNVLSSW